MRIDASQNRLIIFDLDGTLIDSASLVAQIVNDALHQRGAAGFTLSQYRSWFGHGLRNLAKEAYSAASAQTALADVPSDAPPNNAPSNTPSDSAQGSSGALGTVPPLHAPTSVPSTMPTSAQTAPSDAPPTDAPSTVPPLHVPSTAPIDVPTDAPSNPLGNSPFEQWYQQLKRRYAARAATDTPAYDGAETTLRQCQALNLSLAVLTNKIEAIAVQIVSTLFPQRFDSVCGLTDQHPPKPDPTRVHTLLRHHQALPTNCVLVGDSVIDWQTAAAAGIGFCAALWGYWSPEERAILTALPKQPADSPQPAAWMAAAPPIAVIKNIADLPKIFSPLPSGNNRRSSA